MRAREASSLEGNHQQARRCELRCVISGNPGVCVFTATVLTTYMLRLRPQAEGLVCLQGRESSSHQCAKP